MKIRKLPSGSYNIRVEIPSTDGKRHWKSITASDRATVKKLAAEYDLSDHDGRKPPTIAEAVERYINAQKAVLSPYTVRGYQFTLDVIKRSDFGCFAVRMTRPDAQKIVTELAADGKSPKTVRNYVGLISASVKFAGYDMPQVTLPQQIKKEYHIPTEDEMKDIIEAADGTPLEIPIALGMMGLRRGEICGLTLDDLDGSILHIRRAAVDIAGEQSTKPPKTFDSDRYVQIPDAVADKIRAQGYVTELTPEKISRRFMRFMRKHGYDGIRFHDLRHFFASYCHNVLKLSDAQIQKLGGWKTDYVMKKIYIQSMNDSEAAASAATGMASFLC